MRQRVVERDALGWVEREDFVEQILQLTNLAHLILGQILIRYQLLLQVPDGLDDTHDDDFFLSK